MTSHSNLPIIGSRKRLGGVLAKLTQYILLSSLFATITNLIPFSVIGFIWLALLLPFIFFSTLRLPRVTFWGFAYYLISIISLCIYDPKAILTPEFYRYDGNFFVSFMPILLLPIAPYLNIDLNYWVKKYLIISTMASAIIASYQFIANVPLSGLFIAMNAFGGFLMILMSFTFSWYLSTKIKYIPLILLTTQAVILLLSYSRGSMLGIIFGIISYLAIKKSKKWIVKFLLIAVIAVQVIIIASTYPVYVREGGNMDSVIMENSSSEKQANIMIRAYENWPRGLFLFLNSPLFGAGVGAANDIPFKFSKDSIFQMNNGSERIYSSAHAHNTYLHILGEQGLLGLGVFLAMWASLYRQIFYYFSTGIIRDGLLIGFWALTFASFTEHRIPSPSNIFSYIIMFFLAYCVKSKRIT